MQRYYAENSLCLSSVTYYYLTKFVFAFWAIYGLLHNFLQFFIDFIAKNLLTIPFTTYNTVKSDLPIFCLDLQRGTKNIIHSKTFY